MQLPSVHLKVPSRVRERLPHTAWGWAALGVGFSTYIEMCGLAPSRILGALNYGGGGWEAIEAHKPEREGRGHGADLRASGCLPPRLGWREEDEEFQIFLDRVEPVRDACADEGPAVLRTGAWTPYAYIAPALMLIGFIFAYPVAQVVNFSTRLIRGNSGPFVGLNNYRLLFDDPTRLSLLLRLRLVAKGAAGPGFYEGRRGRFAEPR